MKLAISNIAWEEKSDREMYEYLAEKGIGGLEIAPTRIFSENPYAHLKEAESFAKELKQEYGLQIPSIQSIWYGRSENIFNGKEEREVLIAYTKEAIHFAAAVGSHNLVFGCPRNRNQNSESNPKEELNQDVKTKETENREIAIAFFSELGEYAKQYHTVLAMEANPPIYHTNFINTTEEAFTFAKECGNQGFGVNLDTGTMLQNAETIEQLHGNLSWINHVHISEPNLQKIEPREIHIKLLQLLQQSHYDKYLSIEMKNLGSRDMVKETIDYISAISK